jgi:hypothetical protein
MKKYLYWILFISPLGIVAQTDTLKLPLLDFDKPLQGFLSAGFNTSDGFMLGAWATYRPRATEGFSAELMPMYGFNSKRLVGKAHLKYQYLWPKLGRLSIGNKFKSFNYRVNDNFGYTNRFFRNELYSQMEHGGHRFGLSWVLNGSQYPTFDTSGYTGNATAYTNTFAASWSLEKRQDMQLSQYQVRAAYQILPGINTEQRFVELSAEWNQRWYYHPKRYIGLRLYAAGMPYHSNRNFGAWPLNLIGRGPNDWRYEQDYLGRLEQDNFWSSQLDQSGGQLKFPAINALNDGRSNAFVAAVNLRADPPIQFFWSNPWLKLQFYADLGYFYNTAPSITGTTFTQQLFASGGLLLNLFDSSLEVYLPIASSKNLKALGGNKQAFFEQITFSINLERFKTKVLAIE